MNSSKMLAQVLLVLWQLGWRRALIRWRETVHISPISFASHFFKWFALSKGGILSAYQ